MISHWEAVPPMPQQASSPPMQARPAHTGHAAPQQTLAAFLPLLSPAAAPATTLLEAVMTRVIPEAFNPACVPAQGGHSGSPLCVGRRRAVTARSALSSRGQPGPPTRRWKLGIQVPAPLHPVSQGGPGAQPQADAQGPCPGPQDVMLVDLWASGSLPGPRPQDPSTLLQTLRPLPEHPSPDPLPPRPHLPTSPGPQALLHQPQDGRGGRGVSGKQVQPSRLQFRGGGGFEAEAEVEVLEVGRLRHTPGSGASLGGAHLREFAQ